MSINQRIKRIIEELFEGNDRAFSTAVGVSPSVIAHIVGKRQSSPSFEVADKIISSVKIINAEWFVTGKGSMYKLYDKPISNPLSVVAEDNPSYQIKPLEVLPFFDTLQAVPLTKNGFALALNAFKKDKIALPFIRDYDFSFRQAGRNMIDPDHPDLSIYNGDIIACKLRQSRSHLRWGEIYVLITLQGCIIQKVIPSSQEGYITCVSYNEKEGFMPYDMPYEEVLDWAVVVSVTRVRMLG
ncbi:hypothetical protein CLV62_1354 [Dysgonomonas alginatilytica]|uniref:Peptidase S24/S26A/S26B/S26C domain-containing protein n=1 Tax=Dysgonomonas alginatilytica TaxID=1605892 RepID=A0A2V3PJE6_9BACT|nr:hypothetical protein [Dysgonomonas alginatilytica]PXV59432.1 hypothetical protein CLV62_1354 [Dysgonomonas alginatilytica]